MRALAIGVMALVCAACTPAARGTFVLVQLDTASPVPPGLRTIVLDLELGGQKATTEITSDSDITLPTSASLEIGAGEGELAVDAIAQTEGGLRLGSAAGRVLLVKDATTTLDLHLSFAGKPAADGGAPDGAIAPQLAFDTDSPFDFGVVAIGGPGGAATFWLRNVGSTLALPDAPLLSSGSSWFSITANQCAGVALAPQQTCAITINVQPKSAGTESAILEVTGSPGGAASLALKATGVVSGSLALSPDPIEAGAVRVGTGQSDVVATVTNSGDQITSGPLGFSLTGSDGPHFSIAEGGSCPAGQALAAHATCTIVVRFAPTSAGPKSATLFVSAGGDGGAVAALHGVGTTPPKLTLDQPTGYLFGAQQLHSTKSLPIILTNTGSEEAGPLLDWALAGSDQFTASGCESGTRLAGGASCTIWVAFAPNVRGFHQATITLGAEPESTVTATIAGIGEEVVTLSVTKSGTGKVLSDPPGDIVCDEASTKCTAVYTISTTVPTVSLTGIATSPATFLGWSGASCTGTGSCVLAMDGDKQVAATFAQRFTLSVDKSGAGLGTVIVNPGSHDCTAACSLQFDEGTVVTITAKPSNGTNSILSKWTGACASAGPQRVCQLAVTGDLATSARFELLPANLAFVSSESYPSNLGSAAAYQTKCNQLATAAGINSATNDAFVAWLASSTYNPSTLLNGSRGWVRADLLPWIDALSTALEGGTIMYPAAYDENGVRVLGSTWSGMLADGTVYATANCSDWTSTSSVSSRGHTHASGRGWPSNNAGVSTCNDVSRILCLQRGSSTTLTPPATSGKRVYLTNSAFVPGGGLTAADAKCIADAPAGVANAKALIVATNRQLADVLDASSIYHRPDGVLVGTGAEIASALVSYSGPDSIEGGIIQTGSGITIAGFYPTIGGVWTGLAYDKANCEDWTTSSASVSGSFGNETGWTRAGTNGYTACNDTKMFLRCVEQ